MPWALEAAYGWRQSVITPRSVLPASAAGGPGSCGPAHRHRTAPRDHLAPSLPAPRPTPACDPRSADRRCLLSLREPSRFAGQRGKGRPLPRARPAPALRAAGSSVPMSGGRRGRVQRPLHGTSRNWCGYIQSRVRHVLHHLGASLLHAVSQ